jgi:hypothetical protein
MAIEVVDCPRQRQDSRQPLPSKTSICRLQHLEEASGEAAKSLEPRQVWTVRLGIVATARPKYTKVSSRMSMFQRVRNTFSPRKPQSNWGHNSHGASLACHPSVSAGLYMLLTYRSLIYRDLFVVLIHQPKASSSSASSKARGKRQRTGNQRSTARSGRPKSPGVPDSVRQNIRAAIDSLLEPGRESKREKEDGKPSGTSCWAPPFENIRAIATTIVHCWTPPSTPPPTGRSPYLG